ncbi:ABC-type transport system, involved in lipoprotein release, permease component [Eubacterium ruminantium]|nr:ABC-type transport system, involved in lipoprotein release, permease component [Eubacterium ruminantium]
MKRLSSLVFRYIRKNKLRTLMTIIAVMVSSFIIFVIFSFGYNFVYNSRYNSYKADGYYDASCVVSRETALELMKINNGEASSVSVSGCEPEDIFIASYWDGILHLNDMSYFKEYDLAYGRYPKNDNEVIAPLKFKSKEDSEIFSSEAQVGKAVYITKMEPDGISEEEYKEKENELRRKLVQAKLEDIKELDKTFYNQIVSAAENERTDVLDYYKLSEEESKPLQELYDKYHKNNPESMLLVGLYDNVEKYRDVMDDSLMEDSYVKRVRNLATPQVQTGSLERSEKNSIAKGDCLISVLDPENMDSDVYSVLVRFKDKEDITKRAEILGERLKVTVDVNEAARSYYERDDEFSSSSELAFMLFFAAIFGLVVMVIIRNSFNISVSERENDYGMYRCIGLTRKQIIKMILLEAAFVGIIGTFLGVLLSSLFCTKAFESLNHVQNDVIKIILYEVGHFSFYFDWRALGFTVLFMAVIVGYSMVSPIEKLIKMSPINALRSREDIDKRVSDKLLRKKKKSRTKRFFAGYPIWYGFRNIRIKKGRFYLLVFSLSVCLGIVVLVGNIMKTVLKTEINNDSKPAMSILGRWTGQSVDNSLDKSDVDTIRQDIKDKKGYKDITWSSVSYYITYDGVSDENKRKNLESVSFYGMSERYYKILEEDISIDNSEEEGVINVIMIKEKTKGKDYLPELKKGDDIELYGSKFHIAGEMSPVVYTDTAQKRLPDILSIIIGNYTFVYVTDLTENVIDRDLIAKDRDIRVYSINNAVYLHIDLEESDGTIEKYIQDNGYLTEDNGLNYRGMQMIKKIIYFIVAFVLVVILINLINVRSADILQRKRELRLLRNIGFSSKEIRRTVISEGIIVSIYAVVIGFILGSGIAYLITQLIYQGNGLTGLYDGSYMAVRYGIDWNTFIITGLTIFLINVVTSLVALQLVKKDYK